MKEKATIYDLWRICKYYNGVCVRCPLHGKDCGLGAEIPIEDMDEINEIILEWCKEHPVKTRQDKFLEMFPNAIRFKDSNIIAIRPCDVDKDYASEPCILTCEECCKEYWLVEVEE